ncbi:MAG: threonine ammonia-lyase, biosynthetic [Desulfocapsaceae bacterium]|jgi:threonine dehydratase|nr:threonine ammonia-lyase, biosynthetic [Desulfocapsaceae bacterium]
MMQKIVKNILTSRVYEVAVETPLEDAPALSIRLKNRIRLKREDKQPVFSFKLRGAYNKIAHLDPRQRERGVITASAGNHAQGVAYAGRKLSIRTCIVMPVTTPSIKIDAVRGFGGEVILHGDNYAEAADRALELVSSSGMVYVHPFDDELVIAGQGTVADEILRQNPGRLDAVFVPIGGGGLIGGMAAYIKALRPDIKVIGVEPDDSDSMARSLAAGKRVTLPHVGAFADGVAVKKVGKLSFDLCRKYVDEVIVVGTDELCSGIKTVYQATRSIVEPAGGLAMAGILKYIRRSRSRGETLVAVNSGANMNFERLRYVAERTRIGEKQEALFAVTIPEQPGSLKRFCHDYVVDRNITEFNYRLSARDQAHIFVGIAIKNEDDRHRFHERLLRGGFQCIDLTDDELAKTHVRYMVGGRSATVKKERLFRFWFPERPGALVDFLDATRGKRNISLFHYRAQGGDYGRVLVGLEVPQGDDRELNRRLKELGYRYIEETMNPAYKLFL